jgi:hypothetical protein
MSRANASRDAWHPHTREDREAILFELQEVLASPHFCNSKRYPALLQYIVENTLAGKSDLIKERTLGVEVFDRPPAYDTNADTVVRYTAGEVRKRLSLYYHEHGRRSGIRISLPVGSYIPEFLHGHTDADELIDDAGHPVAQSAGTDHTLGTVGEIREATPEMEHAVAERASDSIAKPKIDARQTFGGMRIVRLVMAAMIGIAVIAGLGWRYRAVHPRTALDDFWVPAFQGQHAVPICTGGSVFAQGNFSGVNTAGKDIEYPFLSIQIASSIAQLSALLERSGSTTELESAASTPLTALREHPVILLGGYNNAWTLRLLQPLRFHFSPETTASIVDETQPQVHWARDHSLPYSNADDYALVARFRNATTDSWVVVLAGLGRNGTEGAAQFATSPRYMQQLRDRIGSDFGNQNVEAVLKVNVIDGKTGAPSIVAVHVW